MKKLRSSSRIDNTKKIACTVSAAALMLGISSAATVGLHFQENYCTGSVATPGTPAAGYSGFPVTVTAFGVPPTSWENLLPIGSGYSSCPELGFNFDEVIDTTTSTNGLNPLPNGSIDVTWFGPTGNFNQFSGYGGIPPYYTDVAPPGTKPLPTNATGEMQIYCTFMRDGINFGPGSSGGDNSQPGYSINITGLKSLFTNSSFVVELMASGDSIETLTNAYVIDVTNKITNSVSYPNTPLPDNTEGTSYYQGTGGGLSTGSAPLNTDRIEIISAPPQHVAGQFNHAGTISGFIITDKPVVSMSPHQLLSGLGDTVNLSAYAIGVPPLSLQWRFNGQPILGATNLSYTVTNVNAANGGVYDMVVTNSYGSATSKSVIVGDPIQQGSVSNIVFDSNPVNQQNNGVNMGATWEASSSDGTITRSGVMSFDAQETNGITVADTGALDSTNGSITFWMRSAGTDQTAPGGIGAALVNRATSVAGSELILVQIDGNPGSLYFQDPNGGVSGTSPTGVSDNKWHFVAFNYSGSGTAGTTVYLDGQLAITNAPSGTYSLTGDPLDIGFTTDPQFRDYNGLLDDVRYYGTNLTPAQITTIYNSGSIVDTNNLQMRLNFDSAPGSALSLSWQQTNAVLQSASAITGPWKDVSGAASPFTIVPTGTQQFFRYRYTHTPQTLVSNPYLM